MQYQVPQFIEVEDKIFGPFTFRQFLYLIGGVGVAFVAWRTLPIFIAAPIGLGMAGLGAALAFVKYNNRPLILAIESAFFFLLHKKLYLWDSEKKTVSTKEKKTAASTGTAVNIPKLADSKLHELAWSLDIKERIEGMETGEVPSEAIDRVAPIRVSREERL